MEISLKKTFGNVGTRTCVAGISSQQRCYIPLTITHPQVRVPTLPEGFFNNISMTNIAIYIIKMNYGTIVVLITSIQDKFRVVFIERLFQYLIFTKVETL